jgi:hypothetical protein
MSVRDVLPEEKRSPQPPMPKMPVNISRAAPAELIKRTNQTPVRITAQTKLRFYTI